MSKGWSDSTPRFLEERKPVVERPSVMDVAPRFCWCGEQHEHNDTDDQTCWEAGTHPWSVLD